MPESILMIAREKRTAALPPSSIPVYEENTTKMEVKLRVVSVPVDAIAGDGLLLLLVGPRNKLESVLWRGKQSI